MSPKHTKREDVTIKMEAFNAKVREEKVDEWTRAYCWGARNKRGNRLTKFCQRKTIM